MVTYSNNCSWVVTICVLYSLHHHHVIPLARLSMALSRHSSRSFIDSGRSSELHPVSSLSCCMYVRAGRPAFVQPYEGVLRRTSLMSSSLLLQQCPACLVRLTLIVFVMGGRWLYSWGFLGCCLLDLFKIARSILVQLPSSFFSIRLVSVHVVHPYSNIDTTAAWKKLCFILSVRSDFHMTDSLLIAAHTFVFLSMLSILGSIRFRSRALYILAAMDVSVIPPQILANPRSPFLAKGRMHSVVFRMT